MENWGLVNYIETALLYNENSTESIENVVVTILVHETTHQWTGNIVTAKW